MKGRRGVLGGAALEKQVSDFIAWCRDDIRKERDMSMDWEKGIDTRELDRLGAKFYGEAWPNVRAHNIKRLKGDDPAPLGQAELDRLVNGLRKLLALPRMAR